MPPYVPRKRLRDQSPETEPKANPKPPQSKNTKAKGLVVPPRKPTLFDDLDASSTPHSSTRNSNLLEVDDSQDDESSLTSLSDADFEDVEVPLAKRLKLGGATADEVEEDDYGGDDDDEDIEFEDVEMVDPAVADDAPMPTGDLELTLIRDTRVSIANLMGKKGPSKTERKIRIAVHCMHVQLLMWHNAIRNSWLCDPELQGILLSHVPPRLFDEVERWRRNSGLDVVDDTPKKTIPAKGKSIAKGKGKAKGKKKAGDNRSRDWGDAATRLEKGTVDMSHGDPLFRLIKSLSAWWKQRFRITAPGLRKWGYMTLERLDRLTKAYKQEEYNPDKYGERIRDLDEFRKCAQECAGSRDVGAQLFTALLRALGLEARLVASLQPLGYGWNKLEEADPEKEEYGSTSTPKKGPADSLPAKAATPKGGAAKASKPVAPTRNTKRDIRQQKTQQVSDSDLAVEDSDDDSVIDIPEPTPSKARSKVYDKDLEFPHYWTEVLSPVTHKYLSVDPIVKSVVATNRELVESFEPRGSKADKAKQVMSYAVGYAQDGTAKDVTVRYLKRQMLPGRTKGMRMPLEKIPVYNQNGKVTRYDMYDWFKATMKGYARGGKKHPITEVDEEEDSTDLKPATIEKKEVKEGEETLQYYKQSKEFVLERHLKREEALLPNAKPIKMFKNKGKAASAQEEPVYSRKDVVQVKSAETWHKQGRAPIAGEEPLKRVPYRAATTNRRREIAEAEAATGEKVLQGLYSFDQTDWIIPPPIKDGKIPKNEYGNIDLFAEHMCPEGAVHVPYRGAVRVCKRLGIDYAEAVVDFEFGHRMAVPVIQGVVVAEEYHDQVMEELAKDEAEKSRKEDEKRRKAALGMWRKFMMGLRIVERIRRDYGHITDDVKVFERHGGIESSNQDTGDAAAGDEDMGGGFLPEGYEPESPAEEDKAVHLRSGYFPVVDEDEDDDDGEGGFVVEYGESAAVEEPPATKESVMSTKPKKKAPSKRKAALSSRRRRRRNVPSSSEDDQDEDDDEENEDD